MKYLACLLLWGTALGCSDPGAGGSPDGASDLSGGGGGGGPTFRLESVSEAGGDGTAVAVDPGGRVHAFYLALADEQVCPPPPNGMSVRYRTGKLWHAQRTGPDAWSRLEVSAPGEPVSANGLAAVIDPKDRQPVLSYMGGTKGAFYCSGSDAMLARYDGSKWSRATVATDSTAGKKPVEQNGDVEGSWSALAVDPAGTYYLLWQDLHYGGFQQFDTLQADLELAVGAGTPKPTKEYIRGNGAGLYSSAALTGKGALAVAFSGYNNRPDPEVGAPATSGVTVGVRRGTTWSFTRLVETGVLWSSLAVAPKSGRIGVAYYDEELGILRLAESDDEGATFKTEIVDRDGLVGRKASLRYDADDRPVIAYYRCGDYRPDLVCDPTKDGLRLARRDAGAWRVSDVDRGGDGACGDYPALALRADGKAVIAYQCNLYRADSGSFVPLARVALEE